MIKLKANKILTNELINYFFYKNQDLMKKITSKKLN
jgi:hypothetical protein